MGRRIGFGLAGVFAALWLFTGCATTSQNETPPAETTAAEPAADAATIDMAEGHQCGADGCACKEGCNGECKSCKEGGQCKCEKGKNGKKAGKKAEKKAKAKG